MRISSTHTHARTELNGNYWSPMCIERNMFFQRFSKPKVITGHEEHKKKSKYSKSYSFSINDTLIKEQHLASLWKLKSSDKGDSHTPSNEKVVTNDQQHTVIQCRSQSLSEGKMLQNICTFALGCQLL